MRIVAVAGRKEGDSIMYGTSASKREDLGMIRYFGIF